MSSKRLSRFFLFILVLIFQPSVFATILTDSDGFDYNNATGPYTSWGALGSISGNGLSNPYYAVLLTNLSGWVSTHGTTWTTEDGGRELVSGTAVRSNLNVTQKIYIPDNDSFARQLTIFENPTGSDITINYYILHYIRYTNSVQNTSSGDSVVDNSDQWMTYDTGASYIKSGFIWDGNGGDDIGSNSKTSRYSWHYWNNITIPAGQTLIYMYFTVADTSNAGALTKTQNLYNLTNANMFDGMSTDELLSVANWVIDTDADGMPDPWELAYGLNVGVDDSAGDLDGDGVTNLDEFLAGSLPNNSDSDADGLSDWDEINVHGTHPGNADTDGDGLDDGDEINTYGTNPNNSDTDGDTMPDGWEVTHGFDPLVNDASGDADSDGLINADEYANGTDPNNTDSDNDGLTDGEEVNTYSTDPLDTDSDNDGLTDEEEVNTYNTDPNDVDSDNDSINDYNEVNVYGTDPNSSDTDGDGMPDNWEINNGTNPLVNDANGDVDGDGLSNSREYANGTTGNDPDSDNDGINDGDEIDVYATNPLNSDTDDDGVSDGLEVSLNTDPNVNQTLIDLNSTIVFSGNLDGSDPDMADVVVDSNGNRHVVWTNWDVGDWELFYTMLDADGNVLIDNTRITDNDFEESSNPSIAIDSQNRIIVVWEDWRGCNSDIYLSRLEPYRDDMDGSAANVAVIRTITETSITSDCGEHLSPRVDIDSHDDLHIVWEDYDLYEIKYASFTQNGTVITAETTLHAPSDTWRATPDIAIDANDNVHMVWSISLYDDVDDEAEVFYTMRDRTGNVLIDVSQVTTDDDDYRSRTATVSTNAMGNVNIVWADVYEYNSNDRRLRYTQINPYLDNMDGSAAVINDIRVYDETSLPVQVDRPRRPYARTDMLGFIHVTYQDSTGCCGSTSDLNYMLVANGGGVINRAVLTQAQSNEFDWKVGKIDKHGQVIAYTQDKGNYNDVLIADTASSVMYLGNASATTDIGEMQIFFNSDVSDLPLAAQQALPSSNFPFGIFNLSIINITPGATVAVTLTLPEAMQQGVVYYKWDQVNGWYTVPVADDDGDNVIVFYLTDGGLGDADGVVNGQIVDPGGPVGVTVGAGGGDGGVTVTTTENAIIGCSLSPVERQARMSDLWLPLSFVAWYLYLVMRRRQKAAA